MDHGADDRRFVHCAFPERTFNQDHFPDPGSGGLFILVLVQIIIRQ